MVRASPHWGVREGFARAEGHSVTKRLVQGHQLGSGRVGCRVSCGFVSTTFNYHPRKCLSVLWCQYHHPHFTDRETEASRDQNLTLGKGWGAPGSFLSYLHPWGPEGSLSAPTDMNFCAVGSDEPISGRWPTAAVAAPYQTPSRPHLSPGQGSQRGLVDSYLAGAARAINVAAGLS